MKTASKRIRRRFWLLAGLLIWTTPAESQSAAVLTYHNDNARTGLTPNEIILTPANVGTNSFGRLFTQPVDGCVYAQPLVMTNVAIPGRGTHNVLVVATENDSVYAFDADGNSGSNAPPLWRAGFIDPARGVTTVPVADTGSDVITPGLGITATPVIDAVSGTIYVAAYTREVTATATNFVHRLHALDIATGGERANSPLVITCANYPGSGMRGYGDTDGAGHVLWNGRRLNTRSALLLDHGTVYVALGSHADPPPYHGWVFAYDARSLRETGVFNTSPNGGRGAIWMGGGGPAADAAGNVYFLTANGDFNTNYPGPSDYSLGDSFVKLATTNGLALADYFSPFNQAALSAADLDLGAGGLMVLPDSAGSAAHPHLAVGAGKEGSLYLVDRDNLGHFNALDDSRIVQKLPGALGLVHSTPAYFNHQLFYQSSGYPLRAYTITNGMLSPSPVAQSKLAFISATPVISANGTNDAIIWLLDNSAAGVLGQTVLHAYSVTNLARELYNSGQAGIRDLPGASVKFTSPTVANGKVYVGAEDQVSVFGLGTFLTAPVISPAGGALTNSVTVTLSDSSPGTAIYYTLDESTPTTNSSLYTGPFLLTNSAAVSAVAAAAGALNSGVATAVFVNLSDVGGGTGLTGAYYTNVSSSGAFGFNGAPALTRVDPVINFQWGAGSFAPGCSAANYSVRWTGMVQPQYTETYTFQCLMDDGVRLWINGRLLIDEEYFSIGPTVWTVSLPLTTRQKYNLEIDYHQRSELSAAQLYWSSPSTPRAVIPATQLYPATNPPPVVMITSPVNGLAYTATASVTVSANADDQYNTLAGVAFYANTTLLGTVTNLPYTVTASGFGAGTYTLTAVAEDTTGLSSTSAPVTITVTNGGGLPYGLTSLGTGQLFLNLPTTSAGILPANLSQTGVFTDTPGMGPAASLVPYTPNTPLWSDGALKIRYVGVPNNGAPYTPDEQITFSPTGAWSFPAGTVFVKTFELLTNQSDPGSIRRLETRLLVRDVNGAVYGVTYKWRRDNSDADLLTNSVSEDIAITTPSGVITQTWYYPSPADCLQCHTPVANYVLGLNTRQFNNTMTYPSGVADNELRTLNRLGLLNPSIDESAIAGYEKLSALTNTGASLQERVKSYLDANCAQCHQPGGTGPTFDARYETALTNQNLINGILAKGNLGYDNACVVVPEDTLRSVLYDRINTTSNAVKMPPLARALIDTNAVAVFAAWINSLPGTPALPPPAIIPPGGAFVGSVSVIIQPPSPDATVYYTLDGSLPTTNSPVYTGPIVVTNTASVIANAFAPAYLTSVAAAARVIVLPNLALGWSNPPAIGYGTTLGPNQLNATANVPGTFAYHPGNGAVLNAGTNTLSAVFTPAYAVEYGNTTTTASLVVLPAPLTVTAASANKIRGQANPVFTGTITGLQNRDGITALYASTATASSPIGAYPIIPSLVDPNNRLGNYIVTTNNGTLTVAVLPPTATTYSATELTAASGVLNGTVNPNGLPTAVYFIWGPGLAAGNTNLVANLSAGSAAINVSNPLTNLAPHTAYAFQVMAVNALGTNAGAQLMFDTLGTPETRSVSVSGVTPTSAVLNGLALPRGAPGGAWFAWGTTTNYGQTTVVTNIGGGWAYLTVTSGLAGLSPGTTYHFALFATNSVGATNSADLSFTTPLVIWTNPVAIGYGTALGTNQLNAAANIPGSFAYSPADGVVLGAGTNTLAAVFTPADTNHDRVNVSVNLVVLPALLNVTANDTNRFFGAANPVLTGSLTGVTNGDPITAAYTCGATVGSPMGAYPIVSSLLDPGNRLGNYVLTANNGVLSVGLPPVATTHSATGLTSNSGIANGTVNPNGLPTAVYFIWGPGAAAGNTNLVANLPAGTGGINVSNPLMNLSPHTAYIYQVIAVNALGTNTGAQLRFNTLGAPETKNLSVNGVTATSAVLNGLALPRGGPGGAWFAWGATTNYGQITVVTNIGGGWTYLAVTSQLTGLSPGTTYHFALFATNSVGVTNSADLSFTTPLVIWTNPVVIGYGTALGTNQLNAAANIPGSFAYSPADGVVLGAGTNTLAAVFTPADTNHDRVNISVNLVVLPALLTVTANDTNRFFGAANPVLTGSLTGVTNGDPISATYACGATAGSPLGTYPIIPGLADPDHRLGNYSVVINNGKLAVALAPTAVTHSATSLAPTSATFNGTVNPNGLATAVYFLWGPGTVAGSPVLAANLPAGTTEVNVSNTLTGLAPHTAYAFQVVAVNAFGTNAGAQFKFNTLDVPRTINVAVDGVTSTAALLGGLVLPRGAACGAWFAWGATTNYGQTTVVTNLGNGWAYLPVTNQLAGLSPGTTYHFRLFATNSAGATNSADVSFTTGTLSGPGRDFRRAGGKPLSQSMTILGVLTLENGTRQIDMIGKPGKMYVIEAAGNPEATFWTVISTNTAGANGQFTFTDPSGANAPNRYYRLRNP